MINWNFEKKGKYNDVVTQVWITNDYDKFKFISQNREPDHVKALILSFKDRLVPNAILCNEKFEIIDGQNRFLASKEIGAPIYYYIINGLGIYDVASLNSYGKNWNTIDYIKMWASLGKEEYKKVLSFNEEFPDLSLQNVVNILGDASTRAVKGHILSDATAEKFKNDKMRHGEIKGGTFKIRDIERSRLIARCVMEYKPFARPGLQIYKQSAFISALIRLTRDKRFDNSELVRKISLYPSLFYRCTTAKQYVDMLEELFNYKRRVKVRFDTNK